MSINLKLEGHSSLSIEKGGEWLRVDVRPCFPWSQPDEFLSLRNSENEELALVERISDLPGPSAEALSQIIRKKQFTFEIIKVYSVETDFQIRVFCVETNLGPRRFQIELEDWPEQLPDGTLVFKDLGGDLFSIPDPEKLDKASRKAIWAFQ